MPTASHLTSDAFRIKGSTLPQDQSQPKNLPLKLQSVTTCPVATIQLSPPTPFQTLSFAFVYNSF